MTLLTDKELKKKYLPIFWEEYEKYYPVDFLLGEGFKRGKCEKCGCRFWSVNSRCVCGDPACNPEESFEFIGKSPAKNKLSYEDVWSKFSARFRNLGYVPVKRYPIVARWNPTMEYTNASIAAFQPHVISGEANPPAEKLVIPQFCFRTVDIDNVGISGAHMTVFNMIGQHQFVAREDWNQEKVFEDWYGWIVEGMGIDKKDMVVHEDSWAGGGNLGCSMEIYSGGCEIGNQVYMLYEQNEKGEIKELDLKVLDMGMGMERCAWVCQGTNTVYEATFPEVIKKLFERTGLKYDDEIVRKYVPYAGLLNIDEVDDMKQAWKNVAEKVGVSVDVLKDNVLGLAGLYSIAEHARSLLILLNDGALPSNTGGGYNIRIMLRRALDFIDKYGWNVDLEEVCEWHAKELRNVFPELSENIGDVKKIIKFEKDKYGVTKQKSVSIVRNLLRKKKEIGVDELLKLYDENGVAPDMIIKEAKKIGVDVEIPENFYALVSELHETDEQKHVVNKEIGLNLEDVVATDVKYFEDYEIVEFKAKVVKQQGRYLVLNESYFYPTSGGQLHDVGTIAGEEIVEVVKQGNWIVHVMKKEHKFPVGEEVACKIDRERREQLTQHHTSAHILNAAARKVLGNHVNQASAHKEIDKARLDITHYKALSDSEKAEIEKEANKIISDKIGMVSSFMSREDAEQSFGVRIYQGGVAPGKKLRIVEIAGVDVEACGGTHLKNTFEVGMIKILKTSKVSDSVVRIEFVAGKAGAEQASSEEKLLKEIAEVLGVGKKSVALRSAEIFRLWKDVVKKKKNIDIKLDDVSIVGEENLSDKEILEKTASLLKTQIEHVPKTLKRFLTELKLR